MVCKPKLEGGLGIIDLEKQNKALLKNLHKFFSRDNVPWVELVWEKHYKNGKLPSHIKKGSFWWRDTLKLLPDFKSLASPTIEDGKSALFWIDSWHNGPLQLAMPELHSYAKNNRISVNKAFETENLSELFHLPLSQAAFLQIQELQQIRESAQLSHQKDIWVYEWGVQYLCLHKDLQKAGWSSYSS
jgi:hypothetical protein